MIISIIYLIISFILDNFMSNIFPSTLSNISYFSTIYIIISFVIIYPYFSKENKYYLLLIIFGVLFDVLYTGTFILNMVIFLCIGFCIKMLNNISPEIVYIHKTPFVYIYYTIKRNFMSNEYFNLSLGIL